MISKLRSITVAVTNMPAMADFYSAILAIEFDEMALPDFTLYKGKWNDVNFVLCPAEVAGISASQNKYQLDIEVDNIEHVRDLVNQCGGTLAGDIVVQNERKVLSAADPDGNSVVFIKIV